MTQWNSAKAPVPRSPVSALHWQTVCRLTEHNIRPGWTLYPVFSWPAEEPILALSLTCAFTSLWQGLKAQPFPILYLAVSPSSLHQDVGKSSSFHPDTMSTMVPVLLSLLLLLGLANTQYGHYSLSFHYTGVSTPKAGFPSFQATGYLNDLAFLHYDSKNQVAQPLGPWTQVKGMVNWGKETRLQKAREKTFMETLTDIIGYSQDTGNHTLQGKFGCELRDNNYCGAFWTYIYDGQEYIKFVAEIPAWFPRQTQAVFTKVKWETEGSVQRAKAYLEQECPRMLRNYLQYSKTFLDHQDRPSVSFTSQKGPGNTRTLKCLAYDFYPGSVSMYWTQEDSPLETDEWGDIVLSKNGTYNSWVTVKVPSSDTSSYYCHVQHSSLAQPLTVPWSEGQESGAGSAS